jgi:hypothetical protein
LSHAWRLRFHLNGERAERVAEIVQPQPRQTGRLEGSVEAVPEPFGQNIAGRPFFARVSDCDECGISW